MAKSRSAGRAPAAVVEVADNDPLPLFPDVEGVDHLVVYRLEPAEDEGHCGQVEPTITEEGLRAKYGGGKLRLTPRDGSSQYVKGKGVRTIKLNGEPLFSNDIAKRKWLKANGAEEPKAQAAAAERAPSMMEMMMFLQKQSEQQRLEMQAAADLRAREAEASRAQREREAEQSHKRQLELLQLSITAREADLAAQTKRIEQTLAADRERDREFLKAVTAAKGAAEGGGGIKGTLELLAAAKELFGGGDGESDPLASLAANAPAIMTQLRMMGGGGNGAAPAGAPARTGKGAAEPFVIEGPLGAKASQFFGEVARRGIDPSAFFNAMIEQQAKRFGPAGAPVGPAAPPAAAPPASAKTAAANGTRPAKGGTTKSAPARKAAAAAR